jgi:HAD superfamily hydrolase (TIGR01490 family)
MRRAAFFDLDGTLLTVNTAAMWVKRERKLGNLTRVDLAKAMLFLIAYRFSIVDIDRAFREALATLKGIEEEVVREMTHEWYRDEVARHAAPGSFAVVEKHRQQGDLLVLVTSSSLYASEMAQQQFGLDEILCTRYETKDGRFTGEPVRPLCYGPGKVTLVESLARQYDVDLQNSAFYSDSYTDVPLLKHVGTPYIVNPDPRLRLEARRRQWPVLDWRK